MLQYCFSKIFDYLITVVSRCKPEAKDICSLVKLSGLDRKHFLETLQDKAATELTEEQFDKDIKEWTDTTQSSKLL